MSAILPERAWQRTGGTSFKVLMVDDSIVMRSIVERILDTCQDVDLVGKVATTADAFAFLNSHQVDIVLLDHEMPSQKGLDALPDMITAAKGAHVVMLSSHCKRGSKVAVSALSMGASDAIEKPVRGEAGAAFGDDLLFRLRRLARSRGSGKNHLGHSTFRAFPSGFSLSCIGIGASTGGIHTLGELLAGLTEKPGVPILITQHLPETFIPYYAQQVGRMTNLPVCVVHAGQLLEADRIYIASGNSSLSCRRDGGQVRVVLSPDRDPITNARPSVNHMFSAIAECFGEGALGIVLTGIGRDGTAGARRIVESGGVVIAQDRESSVVWGMPGSVTRAGLACANLRPSDMFAYLREQCEVRA